MSKIKVLGLDLGTNSIGWGIVEFDTLKSQNSYIPYAGVRIFPEGVAKDSHGKEISKNQQRREKRQVRRIYSRRKQTIESLILELIKIKCFPDLSKIEGLENTEKASNYLLSFYGIDDLNYLTKKFKAGNVINENYLSLYITKIVQYYGLTLLDKDETNPVFKAIVLLKDFFGLNPYELRNISLRNERPLNHFELGRIFYHLAQRKGFLSSAKTQSESTKDEEGFHARIEGLSKEVKNNGFSYYGEYFYDLQKKGQKVRNKPTARKELISEFNQIWEVQKNNPTFYNFLTGKSVNPYLDERVKSEIRRQNVGSLYERICTKIIYYQRPLKSQKYLVGLCSLERYSVKKKIDGKEFLFWRGKTRCPVSSLAFEEYRMLCEVNNIKIELDGVERELNEQERIHLISLYNNQKEKFKLSKFAKDILPVGAIIKGIADKESLPASNAYAVLRQCFGSRWPNIEKKQKEIWWELYFALVDTNEKKDIDTGENANDNNFVEKKKAKSVLASVNEKKWNLSDDNLRMIEEVFPFKGDIEINSNPTNAHLKKLFGDAWEIMPFRQSKETEYKKNNEGFDHLIEKKKDKTDKVIYREDVWHNLYYHDNKDWLLSHAKDKWVLSPEQLEILKGIRLKQGFSNLSLNAIEKILVYLRLGLRRDKAIFLANLPEVFNIHLKTEKISWQDFTKKRNENNKNIEDKVIDILEIDVPNELKRNRVLNKLVSNFYKENPEQIKDVEDIKKISPEWESLPTDQQKYVIEEIRTTAAIWKGDEFNFKKGDFFYKTPRQEDAIKSFLKSEYPFLSNKDLSKLYHPSQIESYPKSDRLGSPQSPGLKNPVVIQTLYELRHLVNELIDKKLIDPLKDKVRVEMSRELNDQSKRAAYRYWQNNRRELWNKYRQELKTIFTKEYGGEIENYEPGEYDLLKYFLWKELDIANNGCCPYTNEKICFHKLYGDKATIDIEHIVPYSLSCDDSLENLTLCEKSFNRDIKKNQVPSELQKHKEILGRVEKWKKIYIAISYKLKSLKSEIKRTQSEKIKDAKKFEYEVEKMRHDYFKEKHKKFIIPKNKIDDKFKNRQLPETGYINRLAVQYLKSVFNDNENPNKIRVFSVSAKAVEQFRRVWNLQPENEAKDRSEYYHHAKDALLTACMEKGIYDKMAKFVHQYGENWYKWDYIQRPKFNEPWQNFSFQVNQKVNGIIISHRQNNKLITATEKKVNEKVIKSITVRGALHAENYYGKIKDPYNQNRKVIVKREPLNKLSIDKLLCIADKGIAAIVLTKLNQKISPENPIFRIITELDDTGKVIYKQFELMQPKKEISNNIIEAIAQQLAIDQFFITIRKDGKNIGKMIPIKSVKIIDRSPEETFRSIYKGNQKKYVAPENNFGIGIYGETFPKYQGNKVINRDFETITFFDAVKNYELPKILGNLPLLITLKSGDYVLIYDEDETEEYIRDKAFYKNTNNKIENESNRLFRLATIDQNSIIVFTRHFKAVKKATLAPPVSGRVINGSGDVIRRKYSTFIGFKVIVDRLGNVKPA